MNKEKKINKLSIPDNLNEMPRKSNLNADDIVDIILMLKAGDTQEGVAKWYGVSQPTISKALNGLIDRSYTFQDRRYAETPIQALSFAVKQLVNDREESRRINELERENEVLREELKEVRKKHKVLLNTKYRHQKIIQKLKKERK